VAYCETSKMGLSIKKEKIALKLFSKFCSFGTNEDILFFSRHGPKIIFCSDRDQGIFIYTSWKKYVC
jgi:Tol biopolymer transport system component